MDATQETIKEPQKYGIHLIDVDTNRVPTSTTTWDFFEDLTDVTGGNQVTVLDHIQVVIVTITTIPTNKIGLKRNPPTVIYYLRPNPLHGVTHPPINRP